MEWLSQNWIWVVVGIGLVWLLSRSRHGGLMGGCGAHGAGHGGAAGDAKAQGMDAPLPPVNEKAGSAAERAASSHRHGRGGCC